MANLPEDVTSAYLRSFLTSGKLAIQEMGAIMMNQDQAQPIDSPQKKPAVSIGKSGGKTMDSAWLIAVGIILLVVLGTSPVHLKCERGGTGGAVYCIKQTRLLGIFSQPEERIYGIRGARLTSVPGDEYCDPCYRVELETAAGFIPLKAVYSNGNSQMQVMVDELNSFVRREEPGTLDLVEPGLFTGQNFACLGVWLIGYFAWRGIKAGFGKNGSS